MPFLGASDCSLAATEYLEHSLHLFNASPLFTLEPAFLVPEHSLARRAPEEVELDAHTIEARACDGTHAMALKVELGELYLPIHMRRAAPCFEKTATRQRTTHTRGRRPRVVKISRSGGLQRKYAEH